MKQYQIVILPDAEKDLEASYLYIKEDSPNNALSWYQDIYTKIQTLSSLPLRCPLAPENDYFEEEIRHLIVKSYRVLFTINNDTVFILHARHGHKQWIKPKAPHT